MLKALLGGGSGCDREALVPGALDAGASPRRADSGSTIHGERWALAAGGVLLLGSQPGSYREAVDLAHAAVAWSGTGVRVQPRAPGSEAIALELTSATEAIAVADRLRAAVATASKGVPSIRLVQMRCRLEAAERQVAEARALAAAAEGRARRADDAESEAAQARLRAEAAERRAQEVDARARVVQQVERERREAEVREAMELVQAAEARSRAAEERARAAEAALETEKRAGPAREPAHQAGTAALAPSAPSVGSPGSPVSSEPWSPEDDEASDQLDSPRHAEPPGERTAQLRERVRQFDAAQLRERILLRALHSERSQAARAAPRDDGGLGLEAPCEVAHTVRLEPGALACRRVPEGIYPARGMRGVAMESRPVPDGV